MLPPVKWLFLLLLVTPLFAQELSIARIKYDGGGDWYGDPTSLPNLLEFVSRNTDIETAAKEDVVELDDPRLFAYPYLYMTGHGNVHFSERQAQRLRLYLSHGGFLHVDDNYGLDEHFRREIRKVFPDHELVEVPFDHAVYHSRFEFPHGLPKIHEHDNKPPRGYGIYLDNRLVLFYTWECDLGDGWEDPEVHEDPEELRQKALRMGTNILVYALGG